MLQRELWGIWECMRRKFGLVLVGMMVELRHILKFNW